MTTVIDKGEFRVNIYLECVGYLASVLCVVSLVMSDVKKLRWINLIASATFVFYCLMTKSYPVALTNAMIVIADIYYLVKIYKDETGKEQIVGAK